MRVGLRKISSKTRASIESVSEQDCCQIGKTAIVVGDVNAVHARVCSPPSLLALNERSLLIERLSFSNTKTVGDVYIDDLVILSV